MLHFNHLNFCVPYSERLFSVVIANASTTSSDTITTCATVVDSDGHTQADYDEMALMATDSLCPECQVPLFVDPTEDQLRLHLHALRYHCKEFDFTTTMPEWAHESKTT
jgi:hypothetical protein